jgi:hypothetical protein
MHMEATKFYIVKTVRNVFCRLFINVVHIHIYLMFQLVNFFSGWQEECLRLFVLILIELPAPVGVHIDLNRQQRRPALSDPKVVSQ